jgi:hypothetical protein
MELVIVLTSQHDAFAIRKRFIYRDSAQQEREKHEKSSSSKVVRRPFALFTTSISMFCFHAATAPLSVGHQRGS